MLPFKPSSDCLARVLLQAALADRYGMGASIFEALQNVTVNVDSKFWRRIADKALRRILSNDATKLDFTLLTLYSWHDMLQTFKRLSPSEDVEVSDHRIAQSLDNLQVVNKVIERMGPLQVPPRVRRLGIVGFPVLETLFNAIQSGPIPNLVPDRACFSLTRRELDYLADASSPVIRYLIGHECLMPGLPAPLGQLAFLAYYQRSTGLTPGQQTVLDQASSLLGSHLGDTIYPGTKLRYQSGGLELGCGHFYPATFKAFAGVAPLSGLHFTLLNSQSAMGARELEARQLVEEDFCITIDGRSLNTARLSRHLSRRYYFFGRTRWSIYDSERRENNLRFASADRHPLTKLLARFSGSHPTVVAIPQGLFPPDLTPEIDFSNTTELLFETRGPEDLRKWVEYQTEHFERELPSVTTLSLTFSGCAAYAETLLYTSDPQSVQRSPPPSDRHSTYTDYFNHCGLLPNVTRLRLGGEFSPQAWHALITKFPNVSDLTLCFGDTQAAYSASGGIPPFQGSVEWLAEFGAERLERLTIKGYLGYEQLLELSRHSFSRLNTLEIQIDPGISTEQFNQRQMEEILSFKWAPRLSSLSLLAVPQSGWETQPFLALPTQSG